MGAGKVAVDSRLMARRREVAESRVRSSVSHLLLFLGLAGVAAIAVWLFRSPFLAVNEINVGGVLPTEIARVIEVSGIKIGQPLVGVKVAVVEQALLSDPRVLTAKVDLDWPQAVAIQIVPRLPIAWVETTSGWGLVGLDAVVIETADRPRPGMATLQIASSGSAPSAEALGGLAFLAELHPALIPGASVTSLEEELWATVAGMAVRLGRPIDMEAKAHALSALLAGGVQAGSTINLLAPTRPAVFTASAALLAGANPQATVEP